jgi:hypothetical protein
MATSGTYSFNMSIDEVINEALELAYGLDHVSGQTLKSARRSLNLLFRELENKRIPLYKVEEKQTTVSSSVATYDISAEVLDIYDMVNVRDNTALPMTKWGYNEYNRFPNRTNTGRSTKYFVDKRRDNVRINLWPLPDNSTDVLRYFAFTRIQDVANLSDNLDIHVKYLPVVINGLAYKMAMKNPRVGDNVKANLLRDYTQALLDVQHEDRERTPLFISPALR